MIKSTLVCINSYFESRFILKNNDIKILILREIKEDNDKIKYNF